MAVWLSHLGYTQICVARGIVSWERKDTAAGKLQLWCSERDHDYWLYARKTVRDDMEVCKVIDVSRYPAAGVFSVCSEMPSDSK